MDESSSRLIAVVVLVIVEALITLAYAALVNSRQSELQEQVDEGNSTAKLVLNLLDAQSRLYLTYTLAITLIHFSVALLIGTLLFEIWSVPLAFIATGVLAIVTLALGVVLPESVGSAYANAFAQMLVRPMQMIVLLLSPLVATLLVLSQLLARVLGSDSLVNTVTPEEILSLVNEGYTGGTIEDEEKEMIFSVLQLDQTAAKEVMVPRPDIAAVEVTTPIMDAQDIFVETGFSRIPVYDDNIDNIVGLLYAKDILSLWANGGLNGHSVRTLVRSVHYVPETMPADELLRDLQTRNIHMAIVIDEYGGTSGLVTIENLLEEIVGDIRDEYDTNEEYEYIQNSDDEYIIDASMDLDDINELLGTNVSTEESDTLGGYIYTTIGRVPIVGEIIETEAWVLRVRSLEGRRIRKVLVKLLPRPEDLPEPPDEKPKTEPEDSPLADA